MNIKGFLTHLQTRGYSTGTLVSYRSELQMFETFLRDQQLQVNQVKPSHVEKYVRWRDRHNQGKPASVRRRLAALSSFYDFLAVMANDHIRNPVRPLRRPRRQPPRPRPLNEQQVATLTEGVTDVRDSAIIGLLLHSGLRLSELCSLDRNSIKVEQLAGGKVIGGGRVLGKGQKERDFLVDLKTLKLLHNYLSKRPSDDNSALFLSNRGRRISQRTVQHLLRTWCRKLGLPMLHPHQLRATYATRLNKVGIPTLEISQLLGHANIDTTQQYIQPDMRRIRTEFFAAYERLNP